MSQRPGPTARRARAEHRIAEGRGIGDHAPVQPRQQRILQRGVEIVQRPAGGAHVERIARLGGLPEQGAGIGIGAGDLVAERGQHPEETQIGGVGHRGGSRWWHTRSIIGRVP